MSDSYHDLFLQYGETTSDRFSHVPLILVVGREPNNSSPFRSTVGNYPLEAQDYGNGRKRTVAFWDQSYGTIGKTAGMSCDGLKTVARRVGASPIIFTDVMPTPAAYAPGSDLPRQSREATDEFSIEKHHDEIFAMNEIMDRVSVVVLAGHRNGSFSKRERAMLKYATNSFATRCANRQPQIETVSTKSMFGNNQPWNLQAINEQQAAKRRIQDSVNCLLELDSDSFSQTG